MKMQYNHIWFILGIYRGNNIIHKKMKENNLMTLTRCLQSIRENSTAFCNISQKAGWKEPSLNYKELI